MTRKRISIGTGVIVSLFAFVWAYGAYRDSVVEYYREKKEERFIREAERINAEIETAYRNDFDGGKTPEETIDLFIAALEKKDITQASKYYELSVQPKARASLEEELEKNGDLHLSINYFTEVKSKGTKKCNEKENGCGFEYVYVLREEKILPVKGRSEKIILPKGSASLKSISLEKNEYTNIWKITQPI